MSKTRDEESINLTLKKLEKLSAKSKSKLTKAKEIIDGYEKDKIKSQIIKEIYQNIIEFNEQ